MGRASLSRFRLDEPNRQAPAPAADDTRVAYERAQAEAAWRLAGAEDGGGGGAWLERAYRFTPSDQNLAFSVAASRLAAGDAAGALAVFEKIAARQAGREVLAGIAACAVVLGRPDQARAAIGRALTSWAPDATVRGLAARVAPGAWCGVTLAGEVVGDFAAHAVVRLDGRPIAGRLLPRGWRRAAVLAVDGGLGGPGGSPGRGFPESGAASPLGSPVDLRALTRTEGFVERAPDGIRGWAWHPGDPDAAPWLIVLQDGVSRRVRARDLSVPFRGTVALARPRGFAVACDLGRPVRVMGLDGRDLWGSPLGGSARAPAMPRATRPPAVSQTAAAGPGRLLAGAIPATPGRMAIPATPARMAIPASPGVGVGVAVVVPVYRGVATTMACLRSVLATLGAADRLIVVNDASPEPGMGAALAGLADPRLTVMVSDADDPGRNLGFPAAANAGMRAADGADVVLLNSDTLVYPGWLETLRAAVHSAADIGTATPLSNDATIFTYPDPGDASAVPADGAALAALALRVNAGLLVEVPTGHGFCLYVRGECLAAVGLLRASVFAQGYGEENDFCERAARRGWRHVAVPSVFVAHEGGVSFGPARHHLLARNAGILARLHPGYRARVDAFIAADPLWPARMRLDRARFLARADCDAVLLVSHGGLGGTARVVRERAAAARAQGLRPVILRGHDGFTDVGDDAADTPNLRFHLPDEAPGLAALLRESRIGRVEIHHLSGHGLALPGLLRALGAPWEVWVHDYQWICARLTLVTGEGRFCGEPAVAVCEACVARWGDHQEVALTPAALRARSAALLGDAAAVIVPSDDVARRIRRHFPAARVREMAWEADPAPRPARLAGAAAGPAAGWVPRPGDGTPGAGKMGSEKPGAGTPGAGTPGAGTLGAGTLEDGKLVIAVVGALGMEKGYAVLLACARDAAARRLGLRFVVAGYTVDDTPLLEAGCFVTGPFKAGEAGSVIGGLGARAAFLPSVWPETWCFALSDVWTAGLDAAVFDIGTPAERVRRTGRGWVLPLGLPPSRVNDVLLNLQGPASRS